MSRRSTRQKEGEENHQLRKKNEVEEETMWMTRTDDGGMVAAGTPGGRKGKHHQLRTKHEEGEAVRGRARC